MVMNPAPAQKLNGFSHGEFPSSVIRKHQGARSLLERLSVAQRHTLNQWLRERVRNAEIIRRLKANFGIRTCSRTVTKYFEKHYLIIVGAPSESAEL